MDTNSRFCLKIEQASVESIVVAGGTVNTSLKPDITITFNKKVDSNSINRETITIADQNGELLSGGSYTLSTTVVDSKTVVKVGFNDELKKDTQYTLKTSKYISDGTYLVNGESSITFTTNEEYIF